LSPAAARRIACDAGIIPAVLGTASQTLDVGRQSRLATGPLRRALVLRDRGCAFPGCDRPPRWTDAHHIQHWSDGGPTDLSNLLLLCGHHHRLVHHSEWRVRINPKDGLPEFVPPSYVDSEQRPRRNKYHRRE
jgi:HNH endonuclease